MRKPARWIVVLSAMAALITGCTSQAATTDTTQEPVQEKYGQTWQAPYEQTTCGEWFSQMSEHERWAATADMLVGARSVWKIDNMPSDSLIDTFEADISLGCEPIASVTIADTGTTLALIGGQAQYGG